MTYKHIILTRFNLQFELGNDIHTQPYWLDERFRLFEKYCLPSIVEQTNQVMKNIEAVLTQAGYSFDDVIKTMCFLDNMSNFAAFNEIYAKYFTGKPARSCVAVKTLPKNVLCEVEVIAYLGE